MRLYHFTAKHHVDGGPGHAGPGIHAVGLLPNRHPLIARLGGLVWLTLDGSWQQVWSPRPIPGLDCDRTEARLTIRLDPEGASRLMTIDQVLPFVRSDWRDDFTCGLDLSAWRAYRGGIPWSSVIGIEYRPASEEAA